MKQPDQGYQLASEQPEFKTPGGGCACCPLMAGCSVDRVPGFRVTCSFLTLAQGFPIWMLSQAIRLQHPRSGSTLH